MASVPWKRKLEPFVCPPSRPVPRLLFMRKRGGRVEDWVCLRLCSCERNVVGRACAVSCPQAVFPAVPVVAGCVCVGSAVDRGCVNCLLLLVVVQLHYLQRCHEESSSSATRTTSRHPMMVRACTGECTLCLPRIHTPTNTCILRSRFGLAHIWLHMSTVHGLCDSPIKHSATRRLVPRHQPCFSAQVSMSMR